MGRIEKKETAEIGNDLLILKLAAMAIELRSKLSEEEIRETPSLGKALSALEAVMHEMGWSNVVSPDHDCTSRGPSAEN